MNFIYIFATVKFLLVAENALKIRLSETKVGTINRHSSNLRGSVVSVKIKDFSIQIPNNW